MKMEKKISFQDLNKKRLLVLGGSLWKEAIADFANEHGVVIAATGNDTSAGIFEIAQEHYQINSTDCAAMKKLIEDQKFDGVYMGGSEPVISAATKYLNELGMPCYCTKEQWEFLQNKANFKLLCMKHGLPVVPRFEVTEAQLTLSAEKYPVITKPADGCGSNGFSICRNDNELRIGYQKAKENSESGNVIVEKFVKNDGVVLFLTFSNGKMYFSGIEDKYPVQYENEGSYVAGLLIFESSCTAEFRSRFEDKLAKMFAEIGIKEGTIWIEVFRDGDEYYFNEAGYRYGGTVSAYPVNYLYEINQIASDIYYSLTGESCIFGHKSLIPQHIERKSHYAVYPLHLNAGTICSVDGLDELRNSKDVVFVATAKSIGTTIKQTGSFSQTYALVHFVFDTNEELRAMIDRIHNVVAVRDENNNNMIHRMLDIENINIKH